MKRTVFMVSVFLTLCCLYSCSKPEPPTFKKISDISFGEIKNGKITLKANASFHNPNNFGITIAKTDLDMLIEEDKMADVIQNEEAEVPAMEDFTLPLTAEIDQKVLQQKMIGSALKMLTSQSLELTFKGTVSVKAMKVNIPIPVTYTEKVSFSELMNLSKK